MVKDKSVGIINTTAPFSSPNAKDSLDIALIMGTYEQAVHLYFQGDGVFQLIDQQTPEAINIKNFLKTFSAFEFYDIEQLFVCEQSLVERGLTTNFHIENVQCLPYAQFSLKLQQHHVLLRL